MRPCAIKGIMRCDNPRKGVRGWRARVYLRGRSWSRYFSDGKNGGTHGAFLSALAWSKDKHVAIGKPWIRASNVFADRCHFVTADGRVGVSWGGREGDHHAYRSIAKYGYDEALRIVIDIRKQGLREDRAGLAVSRQLAEKRLKNMAPAPALPGRDYRKPDRRGRRSRP
jgi:hypothetical protein